MTSFILITVLCYGPIIPEIPKQSCVTTKSKNFYKSEQECETAFTSMKKNMDDSDMAKSAAREPHSFYYVYTGKCAPSVKNTSK